MIALSKEIQQAVRAAKDNPVRLIDPETNRTYANSFAGEVTNLASST